MIPAAVERAVETDTQIQLDAENLAKNAENQYKKVDSFKPRFKRLAREQLDAAIEAGKYLCKAKDLLGHGNFTKALKRWEMTRTITFSLRTGRRYMLLATYAETGEMANVANLAEAEELVRTLKEREELASASQDECDQKDESTTLQDLSSTSATELETRVLKTLRRFAALDEQRGFLTDLIEKLNHLLSRIGT